MEQFKISNGHKPLVADLGPQSKPLSARAEKWMLYLKQFKYTIKYTPGRENAADTLSRLPICDTPKKAVQETKEYARIVVADALPVALSP